MHQAIEEKKRKRTAHTRELWSWIMVFIWAILLATFITNVIIVNAEIVSGSMERTIMTDERVMGNRMAYWFREPQQYDIVMFNHRETRNELVNGEWVEVEVEEIYVKRIIGVPGDKVEIIGGRVYLNGANEPLPDYYIPEQTYGNYGPYYVPMNHYFMLGDNRNNSSDSRMWDEPYVYKRDILGKVLLVYYPNLRLVENIE